MTGARLNEIVKSDLSRIMTEIRQSVLLKASSRRSRELLLTVVELDARGWMKDEDLENGGGDAAGGDSLPAVSSSLLPVITHYDQTSSVIIVASLTHFQ